MNGVGVNRYLAGWEKLSLSLRHKYPCLLCGSDDFAEKECHHIDGDKRNADILNVAVLCKACHRGVHVGEKSIPASFAGYKSGKGVMVACDASGVEGWFDPTVPLKVAKIASSAANAFRRRYLKGFLRPGKCNLYVGAFYGDCLFGVLGFLNPGYGKFDIFIKADTAVGEFERSTDLLLFFAADKKC